MIVKSVEMLSVGKVLGCLYTAFGLIFGACASLASLVDASTIGGSGGFAPVLFGVGAIIFLPIFFGAIGFLSGVLVALLYNLVARMVGGIELDLR